MDGRAYGRPLPNRQGACGRRSLILARLDMTKVDDIKAARLAAALRDNLRRRKAQAREEPQKKDPTQAASE